ncbi:MAG: N-acetylmuramoyl-L-alanine amidase [Bacteroidales bacterium]|jgi:N-acetylmuramoyl-L-alanine amidase
MFPEIKNGEQHAFNIYVNILIFLLFAISFPVLAEPSPKSAGKWVIVIDPGHGGVDPGALGSFSKEKNITLAISLKTGQYLKESQKNVTVILTRNDDSFVDLRERPRIANKNNADLFVSIHVNWAKSKSVSGTETYIMGLAKDDANLAVAMKENEVILLENDYSTNYQGFDPKSPESYIMFTLTQNLYQKQSTDLASRIQTQLSERVNRYDRGVKQAGFWVLYNTKMPAILIETGFITNPDEEKYLNSAEGQDFIAAAICRACIDYMNDIDSKSGISAERPKETIVANKDADSSNVLIFMIQVSASKTRIGIGPDNFKGIEDIREIYTEPRYRYTTGRFTDYSEAVKYRKRIENLYPDAFVIALKGNKILPLHQALELSRKNTGR